MIIGPKVLRVVGTLLIGAIGFGLTWGLWHLYQDHQNLHQLVLIELQRRQVPQLQAPPGGGS